MSVADSKRNQFNNVSGANLANASNVFSSAHAYQLKAVTTKKADLSPSQIEKFGGSFGKHDRGAFYAAHQTDDKDDMFNQPRIYKSFQSKYTQGSGETNTNLATATLGSIETTGATQMPLRVPSQVASERAAVANSRQTWQSVVIKNQVKQPATIDMSNRYDKMNVRMLRDQTGRAA